MKNFVSGIALGTALLVGSVAWAGPATEYVQSKTNQITKLVAEKPTKKRDEKLREVINETLDFRELASRSLGKHWEERTPEEQAEFLDLLQELLRSNYEVRLGGKSFKSSEYEISYEDEKVRGDRAIVKSLVKYKEESRPIDYRLLQRDKTWVIYDVVIDDISLEETYRESYVEIIETDGWAELIKLMKEKVKEIKKG